MKLNFAVLLSKQFEIEGKSYNQIQGFIAGKGVFKATIPEQFVPDNLDGKMCSVDCDIAIDKNLKPYFKFDWSSLKVGEQNE